MIGMYDGAPTFVGQHPMTSPILLNERQAGAAVEGMLRRVVFGLHGAIDFEYPRPID